MLGDCLVCLDPGWVSHPTSHPLVMEVVWVWVTGAGPLAPYWWCDLCSSGLGSLPSARCGQWFTFCIREW